MNDDQPGAAPARDTIGLALFGLGLLLLAGALTATQRLDLGAAPAVVPAADLPRSASVQRAPPPTSPPSVPDDAWRTLASGVQIADLTVGSGPQAVDGLIALCDYAMWTADGAPIDASSGRSEARPVHLGRRQVVSGWEDALRGMQAGGRRIARIPAAAGFGHAGTVGVPPDADLLLELRLVSLSPPREQPPWPAGLTLSDLTDLGGGVMGRDLTRGVGEPLAPGAVVQLDYTLWTASGAQVLTTWSRRAPGRYVLGTPALASELDAAIRGMRAGGRRIARVDVSGMRGVEVAGDEPILADLTVTVP